MTPGSPYISLERPTIQAFKIIREIKSLFKVSLHPYRYLIDRIYMYCQAKEYPKTKGSFSRSLSLLSKRQLITLKNKNGKNITHQKCSRTVSTKLANQNYHLSAAAVFQDLLACLMRMSKVQYVPSRNFPVFFFFFPKRLNYESQINKSHPWINTNTSFPIWEDKSSQTTRLSSLFRFSPQYLFQSDLPLHAPQK